MATFFVSDTAQNSILVMFDGLEHGANNYNKFSVAVYRNSVFIKTVTWTDSSTSNYTYSNITGLNSDTLYYFEGYATFNNIEYYVGGDGGRTDAPPAIDPPDALSGLYASNIGTNSATLNWNSTYGADYYDVYRNGTYIGYTYLTYMNVSLPTTGVIYTFSVYPVNQGGTGGGRSINITGTNPRPSDWEWEYTISQGGKFYSYEQGGKRINLMRAEHWNAFTARINLFRVDYKGLSSYTFTTASRSTTPTGVRNCINEAINAINPMLSSAQRMNTIGAGDKVTAKIFTDFVAKIKLI